LCNFSTIIQDPGNAYQMQRGITADTALRLAKFFGTTPEFWMNLQMAYDIKKTLILHNRQLDEIIEYPEAA
jgi:addiction module HigA family antidote